MSNGKTPAERLQSPSWRAGNSLWALTAFVSLGFLGWLGFLYVGLQARRRGWLVAAGFWAACVLAWLMYMSRPELSSDQVGLAMMLWFFGTATQVIHQLVASRQWLHWRAYNPRGSWRSRTAPDISPGPGPGTFTAAPVEPPARAKPPPVVDVNAADVGDFTGVVSLPEGWAEAIVATRERLGGYTSLDQLQTEAYLPPELFLAIRDRLTVIRVAPPTVAPHGRRGRRLELS